MEVCILKPDRIFFKEDAEELLIQTTTGYIGILQEHVPLVTTLKNGVLAFRQGTSWKIFAVMGGFGIIKENRVNILCQDIEDPADIDVAEAEKRVVTARKGMETAGSRKVYIDNQLTFDRQRGRVEAHTMWKNSAGGPPVFNLG
jgi:F-type H+-transporting ATPase subunit epsilon